MIGMIWAQAAGGVIGADGDMPWRLPEDMAHFKEITLGHPVVMGRRTWESFPDRFRPLPGRDNIVVTRDEDYVADGAHVVHDLDAAFALAEELADGGDIWVIGGGSVYEAAMDRAEVLEITDIDLEVDGDTQAPEPILAFQEALRDPAEGWHTSRTGLRYAFRTLTRG